MSTPSWPTVLPQAVLVAGYGETSPNLMLRTQMDAGPPKMRRRFTAGVRPITGTMVMRADKLAILDDFFAVTCQGGTLQFAFQTQRSMGDTGSGLAFPNGSADTGDITDTQMMLQAANYRFVKPPAYKAIDANKHFEVTLELEMMP
jgi:hypothetical protein